MIYQKIHFPVLGSRPGVAGTDTEGQRYLQYDSRESRLVVPVKVGIIQADNSIVYSDIPPPDTDLQFLFMRLASHLGYPETVSFPSIFTPDDVKTLTAAYVTQLDLSKSERLVSEAVSPNLAGDIDDANVYLLAYAVQPGASMYAGGFFYMPGFVDSQPVYNKEFDAVPVGASRDYDSVIYPYLFNPVFSSPGK